MFLLRLLLAIPGIRSIFLSRISKLNQPVSFAGLRFPNPLGVAAGFDKNAKYVDALYCLGFGYVEIGTVTPKPQPGNDKPRLFRLPADKALINRMGFNNDGAEQVAFRLAKRKPGPIVGGNIGKNKATPNENAVADYETCFRVLFPVVDYFVVNVSSPNTPGLRELQDKEPLKRILSRLLVVRKELLRDGVKPVFLKIAPDLTETQLDEILEVFNECGIDGIVATNTTISRAGLRSDKSLVEQAGGCSGLPLQSRSLEVVRYLQSKSGGKLPILGAGGIHSAEAALRMHKAGAGIVQLYTGFIYEGPGLIRRILKAWKD